MELIAHAQYLDLIAQRPETAQLWPRPSRKRNAQQMIGEGVEVFGVTAQSAIKRPARGVRPRPLCNPACGQMGIKATELRMRDKVSVRPFSMPQLRLFSSFTNSSTSINRARRRSSPQ